jgi:hypothetical protein
MTSATGTETERLRSAGRIPRETLEYLASRGNSSVREGLAYLLEYAFLLVVTCWLVWVLLSSEITGKPAPMALVIPVEFFLCGYLVRRGFEKLRTRK